MHHTFIPAYVHPKVLGVLRCLILPHSEQNSRRFSQTTSFEPPFAARSMHSSRCLAALITHIPFLILSLISAPSNHIVQSSFSMHSISSRSPPQNTLSNYVIYK